MNFEPFTLTGPTIRLEPLDEQHAPGLAAAARDGELWNLTVTMVPRPEETVDWIRGSIAGHGGTRGLSFATILRATGEVVGSTSYRNAVPEHRRVEIGATWIARSHQRTRVNTEAKGLMLRHAFEVWGCIRVEFVTDVLNDASCAALRRIGAVEEGRLRNHMIMPDGRKRDSACFSITDDAWPELKARLDP